MTINTMKLPASTMASAYRAGRSAGQNYVDIHRETNKYAMKPDEINKAAYQAQSAEKQVATEIDARAKKADIEIKAGLKRNEIKIQSDKDLAKAKQGTRKAGIVGALGMLGGEIITDSKMGERPRMERPDSSAMDKYAQYLKDDLAKKETTEANRVYKPYDEKFGDALTGNTSAPTNTAVANSNVTGIKVGAYTGSLDSLSAKDKRDIAYIVSSEAERGTDDEFGVAGVVLNRMKSGNYPTSAYDVGHQKGQFEGVEIGNSVYDKALEERLFSSTGLQKLEGALQTLDGRKSFKGQALLKNRVAAEDPMFSAGGNFYHRDYQ